MTIIVAYRLSTIWDVDLIFVLHHGDVVEISNHKDLLDKDEKGMYYFIINF